MLLFPELNNYVIGYFDPEKYFFYIMKTINFQGDLTNMSAKNIKIICSVRFFAARTCCFRAMWKARSSSPAARTRAFRFSLLAARAASFFGVRRLLVSSVYCDIPRYEAPVHATNGIRPVNEHSTLMKLLLDTLTPRP